MHPDVLRDLLRAQPFRPFRIVLTNNAEHVIRHPELALVARTVLKIGYPRPTPDDPDAERTVGVALRNIAQYEII
jgi:hypothetical protein